jgi:hypothetical protein
MSKKKDWKTQTSKVKKFWYFVWYDDSLLAHLMYFGLAFIFIKFLLFPTLGLLLNNDYPIVAIVSGSMQHKVVDSQVCDKYVSDLENGKLDYDTWWDICGEYYEKNFKLSKEVFSEFKYSYGLNIGDVMVLYGKSTDTIEVGETLVFYPDMSCAGAPPGPVIHRLVEIKEVDGERFFTTKGDFNPSVWECMERSISEDRVIGVAKVRVPYIGYLKVLLNNLVNFII